MPNFKKFSPRHSWAIAFKRMVRTTRKYRWCGGILICLLWYVFSQSIREAFRVRVILTGWPSLHCQERSAGFLLFRPTQKYRLSLQQEHQSKPNHHSWHLINLLSKKKKGMLSFLFLDTTVSQPLTDWSVKCVYFNVQVKCWMFMWTMRRGRTLRYAPMKTNICLSVKWLVVPDSPSALFWVKGESKVKQQHFWFVHVIMFQKINNDKYIIIYYYYMLKKASENTGLVWCACVYTWWCFSWCCAGPSSQHW